MKPNTTWALEKTFPLLFFFLCSKVSFLNFCNKKAERYLLGFLFLLSVSVLFTSCGRNGTLEVDLYLVRVEPSSFSIVQGQSTNLIFTLSSKGGFRGKVGFAFHSDGRAPSWLTVSPSQTDLNVSPGETVETSLQIGISKDAPPGIHKFKVVITYDGQSQVTGSILSLTVVSSTEKLISLLVDAREQTFAFASAIKGLSSEEPLDARVAVQRFVSTGEEFAEWLKQLSETSHSLQSASQLFPLQSVDPILVYDTGNIVKDAKEGAKKCEAIEDPIESQECFDKLRRDKLEEVGRFGVASLMGGGASIIAGGALAAASAPILLTVTGGIAAGLAVSWFVSWCTSPPSKQTFLPQSGQACYMVGGKGKLGEPLPVPFAGEGKLILHVEGLTPVVLDINLLQGKELRIAVGPPPRVEYLDAPKGPLAGNRLYIQLRFSATLQKRGSEEYYESLGLELPGSCFPFTAENFIPITWTETTTFVGRVSFGDEYTQYQADAQGFARMEIANSAIQWRVDVEASCQTISRGLVEKESRVKLSQVPFELKEGGRIIWGAEAGKYVTEVFWRERSSFLVKYEFLDSRHSVFVTFQ